MQTTSRDQLKKVFKKVKKLHLPPGLEETNFEELKYYSWPDESSQCLFLVYEYKGRLTGIQLSFLKAGSGPLRLGFCEFCHKHRKSAEVLFVSAETKKRPKHVNYQVRGTWVCADFKKCNSDLKTDLEVNNFFYRILDQE